MAPIVIGGILYGEDHMSVLGVQIRISDGSITGN